MMAMRRSASLVLSFLLAAVAAGASPALAQSAPSAAAPSGSNAGGDFDNDGFADLAAGAPWESVGSLGLASAVSVIPGSAGGLTATGGQLFTQNSPGVPGVAEAFDQFGGVAFNAG
jgi:hypothetical protein